MKSTIFVAVDFVAATKLLLIPQTKYLIILQIEAIIIDHVYFFSANSDNRRGDETKIKCKLTNLNTPIFAPRSDLLIIEPS